MAYANFDDDMGAHPSIRHLSDAAFRLHVCGILYCAKWLTDGRIPTEDVPGLVKRFKSTSVTELVERGRWSPIDGGYVVEDYLNHNPTREVVMERREKAKKRAAESRAKGAQHG